MSSRTSVLALAGVIGLAGWTAAEPPINPLVEGRELNPVARTFHHEDGPASGYVAPDAHLIVGHGPSWLTLPVRIWDLLLDRMTFPLGTAVETEPSCDA